MKTNFIFILCIVVSVVLTHSCSSSNDNVSELNCESVSLPIDNQEEAKCYALSLNDIKYRIASENEHISAQGLSNGWLITANLIGDRTWHVVIKTEDVIPTLSYNIEFNHKGEILKKSWSYNK